MEIKTNWRNFILYGTSTVIETCWLYVILKVLNEHVAHSQLSLFGVLLFYPIALGFNKMIQLLELTKSFRMILTWLLWAILLLVSIKIQLYSSLPWTDPAWLTSLPLAIPQLIYVFRAEVLLFGGSAITWWLGYRLSTGTVNFESLLARFQFGLVILIATFFTISFLQIDVLNAIPVVLIFFFASLAGISIAHAQENKSWLADRNRLQWSWILLASIGVIFLAGFIISALVSHDLLQLVINAIKWLGKLIMTVLAFLASLLPKPEPGTMLPPMGEMPGMPPEEKNLILNLPEALRNWLNLAMGVIWGGLVLVALWQISSRLFNWLRGRFNVPDAEVEPMRGAFKADLVALLKHIYRMLSGLKFLSWLTGKSNMLSPEVLSVYQIYRHLLHWGAKSGYPRKHFQTPNEYLAILTDLLPDARQDLVLITHQYVSIRYGGRLPETQELQDIRQSWDRVKQNRAKRVNS
jgi:hypothetical protein